MKLTSVCRVCLLVQSCVTSLVASPVTSGKISDLLSQADVIAVGIPRGSNSGGMWLGTLTIQTVIKGALVEGSVVSISWLPPSARPLEIVAPQRALRAISDSSSGMFFLQSVPGSGELKVMSVTSGAASWNQTFVPVSTIIKTSIVSAATPYAKSVADKVVLKIIEGIETKNGFYYDLGDLFAQTKSPVIPIALTAFRNHTDKELVCLGFAGSISLGATDVFSALNTRVNQLAGCKYWDLLMYKIRTFCDPSNLRAAGILETILEYAGSAPGLVAGVPQANIIIPEDILPSLYGMSLQVGTVPSNVVGLYVN